MATTWNVDMIGGEQSSTEQGTKRKYDGEDEAAGEAVDKIHLRTPGQEIHPTAHDGSHRVTSTPALTHAAAPYTDADANSALQEQNTQVIDARDTARVFSNPVERERRSAPPSNTQTIIEPHKYHDQSLSIAAVSTDLGLEYGGGELQNAQDISHPNPQEREGSRSQKTHSVQIGNEAPTSPPRLAEPSPYIQTGETDLEEQEEQEEQNAGQDPTHENQGQFSDYDDDGSSFYDSLLSSATDYYWENGRRYHAHHNGHYMLPNDETELDREDMKHHEWMVVTDFRLHLCPIPSDPHRILDIGTGTGIWAMQIAEMYPSASVVGTDISPVQPKWVPPNLVFEVDDLEQEWLHRPGTYDLVNIRFMFLAIKDFPAMLKQAYRTLKPGGYIEFSELELSPTTTPPHSTHPETPQPLQIWHWLSLLEVAIGKSGFDMHIAKHFKAMLKEAGFVDIVETRFDVPWGEWCEDRKNKTVGLWHMLQLKQGLQGIVMAFFTRALGWTPEDVEMFLVGLRKDFDDQSYKIMDHAVVIYGRKPLTAPSH